LRERREEGRSRRKEEGKRKKEKGKENGEKEKGKRERERRGGIRGGGWPRVCRGVRPDSDMHVDRGRTERQDSDRYWCRNGEMPGENFGRLGARTEKDFERI
jgi:hypothetical protein